MAGDFPAMELLRSAGAGNFPELCPGDPVNTGDITGPNGDLLGTYWELPSGY